MTEKVTFASVISNRGFRFLWFNQILVQLAYNTLNFALIIWVFKLVNSNLAVSALLVSAYLPAILFGLFAGVFVDLTDRRRIIILIDFFLVIAFLLFLLIKRSFPLILINTFFVNFLAQFFMPSESSSIPKLVTSKQLFLANSLFSLTLYGSFMVGFSIGGPILNTLGINAVFLMGAFMLFIAFLMAQNLPVIRTSKAEFDKSPSFSALGRVVDLTIDEAKRTFHFIRGRISVIVSIGLLSAVQGVIGILAVVTPSYVERVLHIHAADASYFVMLPLGLGMVVGALLIGRLFHGRPRRSLVLPAVIIGGILFILIGIIPTLAQILQSSDLPTYITHPRYFFRAPSLSSLFALIAFLAGLCTVSIIIPSQTSLQESTPEQSRGKVFSVLAVIMTSVSAVTAILAGGLSDLIGVTPIFISLGVMTLAVGIIALRPNLFFHARHLPIRVREFLGEGHWEK
ncbi:MAG: MFS transporter [Patescibacteria group bacterium]|nr:MFS transporter [Patescibacteria group bacterium]